MEKVMVSIDGKNPINAQDLIIDCTPLDSADTSFITPGEEWELTSTLSPFATMEYYFNYRGLSYWFRDPDTGLKLSISPWPFEEKAKYGQMFNIELG
jgi:hypothetical protein